MKKYAACALVPSPPDDSNLFLAVSRKDDHEAFGLPGGKLEDDETFGMAMERELFEETGLVALQYWNLFNAIDHEEWKTHTFLVDKFSGSLKTKEDIVIKWATREEFYKGPFGKYCEEMFACYDIFQKKHKAEIWW